MLIQVVVGTASDNQNRKHDAVADLGAFDVTSTGVDLAPLEPAGRGPAERIRYERLNSNA